MTLQLSELEKIAYQFRQALEQVSKISNEHWLKNFPKGNCGLVVDFLNYYLKEEKGIIAEQWGGTYKPTQGSHVWTKIGSIYIDLTADQFSKAYLPVIVCESDSYPLNENMECITKKVNMTANNFQFYSHIYQQVLGIMQS